MLSVLLAAILVTITVLLAVVWSVRGCAAQGGSVCAGVSGHGGSYLPPQPPAEVADSAKPGWTARHYWDSFDFADTTQLSDMERMGPAVIDYLQLLGAVPAADAAGAIRGMLDEALEGSPVAFERFTDWYEEALYDPNSPLRSEELYIPVLEYVVSSPCVDSLMKIRPRSQLAMARRNRPGAVATDFAYTTADGRQHRLSAFRARYTLLYFYNPDCAACREIKDYIGSSARFREWMEGDAGLRVLAVYPDEDLTLWRERLAQMPAAWTVGCDRGHKLMDEGLYDLKAIPTIYLLDENKRVILKDAPAEAVEAWLAGAAVR